MVDKEEIEELAGDQTEELMSRINGISKTLHEIAHLQKIANLENNEIIRFPFLGEEITMYLPYAAQDRIQRSIVKSYNFFEFKELEVLRAKIGIESGKTIYDLGANIGNHTVYFSTAFRPKKLVAVEPQPAAVNILKRNIELNDIKNATVVECLMGEKSGKGRMHSFKSRNLGATSFKTDDEGTIPIRNIDDLVEEQTNGEVDFMKIDVEGMHEEVLRGAEKTLTKARPTIWIELRSFKQEYESGEKILSKFGYKKVLQLSAHDFVFAAKS